MVVRDLGLVGWHVRRTVLTQLEGEGSSAWVSEASGVKSAEGAGSKTMISDSCRATGLSYRSSLEACIYD